MNTTDFITRPAGRTVLLAAILLFGLSRFARAANQVPTCAILFDEGDGKVMAPVAGILESNLAQGDATLVERQRIDEVLKEQKLQTLLSPSAAPRRGALGKLLKADLLLLLRSEPQPNPRISIGSSKGTGPISET